MVGQVKATITQEVAVHIASKEVALQGILSGKTSSAINGIHTITKEEVQVEAISKEATRKKDDRRIGSKGCSEAIFDLQI